MKVSLKMADIEVSAEYETDKQRYRVMKQCYSIACSLVHPRSILEGSIAAQGERAEDSEGCRPENIEHSIKPDVAMQKIYG